GRFGTHASNESMAPVYYKRLMFFSHFNAGVRAVDIRDPYHLKEVAHYIPAVTANTDKRCIILENGTERCKVAIQTNNVEVDERGYIYAVDRANTGLHILKLTGAARRIGNFAAAVQRQAPILLPLSRGVPDAANSSMSLAASRWASAKRRVRTVRRDGSISR